MRPQIIHTDQELRKMFKAKYVKPRPEHDPKKLYWSTAEIAKIIDSRPSCIKYWAKTFGLGHLNHHGRIRFIEAELKLLQQVKHLREVRKFTLDGVRQELKLGIE